MTKVQLTVKLWRGLNDHDLDSISRVHAIYGFFTVQPCPSGDELFVEYDASRLSPQEVRRFLAETGLPLG